MPEDRDGALIPTTQDDPVGRHHRGKGALHRWGPVAPDERTFKVYDGGLVEVCRGGYCTEHRDSYGAVALELARLASALKASRQEVERLRRLLFTVEGRIAADQGESEHHSDSTYWQFWDRWLSAARAALAGRQEESDG